MTVPPGDEDVDQDAMAAEWEAQMDGEGEEGDEQDDLAAEWEAMVGGGDDGMGGDVVSSVSGRETTRVLNQDEIDSYLASMKKPKTFLINPVSRQFLTARWSPMSGCRCLKLSLTGWFG